jgi:hypothetical protein
LALASIGSGLQLNRSGGPWGFWVVYRAALLFIVRNDLDGEVLGYLAVLAVFRHLPPRIIFIITGVYASIVPYLVFDVAAIPTLGRYRRRENVIYASPSMASRSQHFEDFVQHAQIFKDQYSD